MKYKLCPRCLDPGFENLKSYSVCHACQFNSVEGYSWSKNEPPQVESEDLLNPFGGQMPTRLIQAQFSEADYELIRGAVRHLSELERKIVFLKFWKNKSTGAIASSLGLQLQAIETILDRSFLKLKKYCQRSSKFSGAENVLIAA